VKKLAGIEINNYLASPIINCRWAPSFAYATAGKDCRLVRRSLGVGELPIGLAFNLKPVFACSLPLEAVFIFTFGSKHQAVFVLLIACSLWLIAVFVLLMACSLWLIAVFVLLIACSLWLIAVFVFACSL
jgi:hypothetical protein